MSLFILLLGKFEASQHGGGRPIDDGFRSYGIYISVDCLHNCHNPLQYFRSHCVLLLWMSHVAWSVCLCVCLCVLGTWVSRAETADPIQMPFGGWLMWIQFTATTSDKTVMRPFVILLWTLLIATGPPTHGVMSRLVAVAGVCRRRRRSASVIDVSKNNCQHDSIKNIWWPRSCVDRPVGEDYRHCPRHWAATALLSVINMLMPLLWTFKGAISCL